ncbi:phage protease [Campylobacter mucosalis]|uniref:phage protease n=1 Tax=Campylobacter mucosalis TaxID=202 RepID=UPI00147031E9|nr:phage protease [Campylobacter mucosalis]
MLFEGQLFALKEQKDKKEIEILLAVTGEWQGHYNGAFKITPLDIKKMIENFNDRKIDLVIDYEHQSLYGKEAPAAGWITQLFTMKDDNELWGKVRWTDKAVEYIKNDEYRYLSPVFNFDARDNKSGANIGVRLESVGLTNTPFLDELGEVRVNSIKEMSMDKDPKINTDESHLQENIQELTSQNEKLKDELALSKVEAAIIANKIAPSQKEWALKYAKSDLNGFNEFILSVIPPLVTQPTNDMFANKANLENEIDVVKLALQ